MTEQKEAPLWYGADARKIVIDCHARAIDCAMRPVPMALYAVAAMFQDRVEARGEALAERMGVVRRISSEWPGCVPSWPPGFNRLIQDIGFRAIQRLGERLTNDLSGVADLIEAALEEAEQAEIDAYEARRAAEPLAPPTAASMMAVK